jgi:O-antigen/teichoic acid export membrane protein
MSLSREQFFKNSVWTFFELALFPLLMIVATPIFIRHLGIEQYGLWMLITTITLSFNILNIGVGDTNIRLISKYRAQDDQGLIKRVYRYNFSFSLFLCALSCLLGVAFYYTHFISFFYKGHDFDYAGNILLLASVSTGIKFVEISTLSVFKAFERFDLNSKLLMISKNTVVIASIFLAAAGYDLYVIFCATILINVINVLIQLFILNAYNAQLVTWPKLTFFKEKLDDLNYNFWYWLQSSIALGGFLADKLVVAMFTDVRTFGYYSIASLVGTHIHNFFLSFGSFIFPRVSYKLAANSEIAPLYYVSRGIVSITGWLIIAFLIVFGDFIFKLWLGAETFSHSIFYIKLYLVFEACMLLIIVPFYFINGTKLLRLNSLFEISMRGSHLIAIFVGYYLAGVNGVLYGLIFSTLANIPLQYYLFHKQIMLLEQTFESIKVLIPLLFLFGASMSENLFFKVPLLAALLISIKLIYFDPARKYTKQHPLFRREVEPR